MEETELDRKLSKQLFYLLYPQANGEYLYHDYTHYQYRGFQCSWWEEIIQYLVEHDIQFKLEKITIDGYTPIEYKFYLISKNEIIEYGIDFDPIIALKRSMIAYLGKVI